MPIRQIYKSTILVEVKELMQEALTNVKLDPSVMQRLKPDDLNITDGASLFLFVTNGRECGVWLRQDDSQRIAELLPDETTSIRFKLLKCKAPSDLRLNYDCFAYYLHGDGSYEWRPCRIIRNHLNPNYSPEQHFAQ